MNVNRLFVLSYKRIEEDNVKKRLQRFFITLLCTKSSNKSLQRLNRPNKFFRFANKK